MSPRYAAFLIGFLLPVLASAQTAEGDLRAAAFAGETGTVEQFVEAQRLAVKPVVAEMVAELGLAVRSGDQKAIEEIQGAIAHIAEVFEGVHGERSLSLLSDRLHGWDLAELVLKVRADSLFAAGVAIRLDDREKAKQDFESAKALYEHIEDANGLAEVTGQLGYVSWYLDRDAYLETNLVALEARKAVDDWQLLGNTYNDLGLAHRFLTRDFPAARDYYLEGERIRRAIGDSVALSRMLPNLGRTYEAMGEYVKARDYYLDGAAFYLAVGDTANWIIQRRNTAGLMTNYANRHTDALAILLDLETDLQAIEDPRAEAIVGLSMGVVRRRLGDYQGAIESYRRVLELCEAHSLDDILPEALNNIGVMYTMMARPDRAVPYLERAVAAVPADTDPTMVIMSLGAAYFEMRDYDTARGYLEQATQSATVRSHLAQLSQLRGQINTRSGRVQEGKADMENLLAEAEDMEDQELRSAAFFGLAEAEERLGNPTAALLNYEKAAAELERDRGLLRAEEDKAGYLAQTRYLYEEIIHFLTEQAQVDPDGGWAAAAFEYAERGKSRAFLDQMAEALAGVSQGVDPEFQSDLEILAANMESLRGQLATASDAAEKAELKGLVRQMEGEYERVEREMNERNPRFASIRYPSPARLDEVQSSVLVPGEVLLQYALGDSSSTLWAVTEDAFEVFQLPPRPDIESQVELLRRGLQDPSQPVPTQQAARLYEMLVEPAAGFVAEASNVVIVPDGALNYVPFEALITDDRGTYLLEAAPLTYVQSASVLRQLRDEDPIAPEMELLAVGDPAFSGALETSFLRGEQLARLPFSGAEVRSISTLFSPAKTTVFLEQAATEEAVKAALDGASYRFVHFATHGLVNDDRPDYSGLALAGEGTDALLQASEIFNMRVRADLVVLSACETGLGQLVKGEGMVGLTRAFMYAGAPSVAVSLWSVSDQSTSLLMQTLYASLRDPAASKGASLRRAKLALLENPETAHPFHWAPFVLVGRSE